MTAIIIIVIIAVYYFIIRPGRKAADRNREIYDYEARKRYISPKP